MSQSFMKAQAEVRLRAWEEAKALLDTAAAEKRDLTGEEQEKFDRINNELDERAAAIETIRKAEEREAKAAAAASNFAVSESTKSDYDYVRALAKGEIRSHNFETRGTLTPSNSSGVVPQSFVQRVYDLARATGPLLDDNVVEVFRTAGGEDLKIPVLSAYGSAGLEGAGATIDESEPTFSSITLGAYKYAFLVPIASELLSDSGLDVAEVLARAAGNSIGFAANTALTTGTGSSQPTGIVTAAGTGVSGTIAGGLFTSDQLVDLVYSVDPAVRQLGASWLMAPSAIRNARKLKDDQGQYVFVPTLSPATPDTLLGFPIRENPQMAAVGSASASVGFGYLPSYKVRIAGGLRADRSDDFKFGNDIVTFRFMIRIDGNLSHQSHFKILRGSAA